MISPFPIRLLVIGSAVSLTACSLSAPSQHPRMVIPAGFKEDGMWKAARPKDHVTRGDWWKMFGDRELNDLIGRVQVSNQTLAASIARAQESAALVKAAKLSFLPTLDANYSATRSGGSSSSDEGGSGGSGGSSGPRTVQTLGATTSWEVDLWGRLRHSARSITADAEAAAADVEVTRLSVQALAAQTYFSLRGIDAQRALLETQIGEYAKSLEMNQNRYQQGVASRGDVAQAEAQLAATKATAIELGAQRATLEHALAVLTGNVPAAYGVGRDKLAADVPRVPETAPSLLLERRPDIAAAERRVASANERIGAACAAFYPSLTLGANGGWRGSSGILNLPNTFWSLGPDLAAPILDRGQRLAEKAQADAAYQRTVAEYRQTVLTGFQEAEDSLANIRILAQAQAAQEGAVKAARESARVAMNEYKAGTGDYLNVVVNQAAALNAERNVLDFQVRRLNATVALVKALGGKW